MGNSNFTFEIRPVRTNDVLSLALLHSEVFPDYFLTHLGISFLKRFYNQFLKYPGCALVAISEGQCIGFVAGTHRPELFFNLFYHDNFMPVILITFQRLIEDRFIRKEIYKRLHHIRIALSTLFQESSLNNSSVDKFSNSLSMKDLCADLLGIGVHSSYRGKGIAEKLVHEFCNLLAEKGVECVSLTVRKENIRAIRFYEKTGWEINSITRESVNYIRSIYLR